MRVVKIPLAQALAATVYLCVSASTATAVNPGMCSYYRDTALSENNRNKQLRCRPPSPRWSDNIASHAGWCSGARLESVANEAVARLQELNSCNHAAMCEQYADNADRASQRNGALRCGYGGARYTSTHDGHRNWCLGARQESVDAEVRARYDDLDRCTMCDQYASEAIRLNQLRITRRCRLEGPRWSSERAGHFGWCMSANLSSVVAEQNARAREAVDCR